MWCDVEVVWCTSFPTTVHEEFLSSRFCDCCWSRCCCRSYFFFSMWWVMLMRIAHPPAAPYPHRLLIKKLDVRSTECLLQYITVRLCQRELERESVPLKPRGLCVIVHGGYLLMDLCFYIPLVLSLFVRSVNVSVSRLVSPSGARVSWGLCRRSRGCGKEGRYIFKLHCMDGF